MSTTGQRALWLAAWCPGATPMAQGPSGHGHRRIRHPRGRVRPGGDGDRPDPQEWPTVDAGCPAARARNETLRASRHYGRAFRKRWTADPDRQTAETHIRVAS